MTSMIFTLFQVSNMGRSCRRALTVYISVIEEMQIFGGKPLYTKVLYRI